MFSVIVIIFQAVALLFIGIFARTTTVDKQQFNTEYSFVGDAFALLLAFTLMYSPFRKLSVTSLAMLLIVVAVSVQTNLLFDTFWQSCFKGFSSNFQLTCDIFIGSLFASLAVLITVLDFMGLFRYWQVYFLVAVTMTFGYSLLHNIITYGLKTFDGGGGMSVFLYSGVCSLMIWALCIRGQVSYERFRIKQSYVNQTLSMIGVMIGFANWPKFNMGGSVATSFMVEYINTTNIKVQNLQNSALGNTYLGLSAAVLTSILFASKDAKEDKMKFKMYIDCFINGGIVIACYQDISLNPASCITMACFSTIITLIVHKYFVSNSQTSSESIFKKIMKNYSKIIFRILFGTVSSIIASIVVATRNGVSPDLLSDYYSRTAGLEIVGLIVTVLFGVVFGALTGIFINLLLKSKLQDQQKKQQQSSDVMVEINDFCFFNDFTDEAHPLYYDIFQPINQKEEEKINVNDYTTKVIRQSLLGAQENPLRMMSVTKPFETKVDPMEAGKPQNNFTKRNGSGQDVSNMKIKRKDSVGQQRQKEANIHPNQSMTIQKSKLKVSEAESIPRQERHKNVARKLYNDDDGGSQIKNQKITERPFLQ